MKSILGIGNALTDILAVFPDETMLREYHLPPGSMQHVDLETGDRIWSKLEGVRREVRSGRLGCQHDHLHVHIRNAFGIHRQDR